MTDSNIAPDAATAAPPVKLPSRFSLILRAFGIDDPKLGGTIAIISATVVLTFVLLATGTAWVGRGGFATDFVSNLFRLQPFIEKEVRKSHITAVDAGYSEYIQMSPIRDDPRHTLSFYADTSQPVSLYANAHAPGLDPKRSISIDMLMNGHRFSGLILPERTANAATRHNFPLTKIIAENPPAVNGIHELQFMSDDIRAGDTVYVKVIVLVHVRANANAN